MGEGFESHWNAAWFFGKAKSCRELARGSIDHNIAAALLNLADDFDSEGTKAEELKAAASS